MNDSEFAAAARHLASRLASLARLGDGSRPMWDGDDVDPVRSQDAGRPALVHGVLDDGLLTGRAGIAVALAACSTLPGGSSAWSMLARQTMHSVLAVPPDPGRVGLGWQSGELGIARGAELVSALTGDRDLEFAGRDRASGAVRAMLADPTLCPDYSDMLDGEAGHLAAVLSASLPIEAESARREVAAQLVARITNRAIQDIRGAARWPMGGFASSVVGMAHGGSGVALALSAAVAAGVAADQKLIRHALRWEDEHYDAPRGGWPDLRVGGRVPAVAWCHGAPGLGLAAACRFRLTADPDAELTFVRARLASTAHRPSGSAFDGTMCHGLAGVVELHLAGAEAWPASAEEHLREARLVARSLTRAGTDGHPPWTCGLDRGRTPNVLLGLAGVAITLVRCHEPAIVPTLAHPGLPASAAAAAQ